MSLDFPEDVVRQYFREKNLRSPADDMGNILFKNVTARQAGNVLTEYTLRHPLLAIYSNMKELVVDAETHNDMEKCVTVMISLFEALSKFSEEPTDNDPRDVYDDGLYRFHMDITKCPQSKPDTYKKLFAAIEDPGELDFLEMTTLKIPGRPHGDPLDGNDRIVIGYAIKELIVENPGNDFKFEDWFVVHTTARIKKCTISYTREPKLFIRGRKILTPFFTNIEAFHLTKSLTLANVNLKIEGEKSFNYAGWMLPNVTELSLKTCIFSTEGPSI